MTLRVALCHTLEVFGIAAVALSGAVPHWPFVCFEFRP